MKKIAGLLVVLMLMGSMSAVAQTQPMPPQQQKVEVDVDDAELAKFAEAYQGLRMVNQEAQQKMVSVVEDEGFEIQRFNEMYQASMNPNEELDVTGNEKEKYEATVQKIEGMQGEFQEKMEEVITDQGFTMERYEKLAMALQTDPEMQQRLQQMLQGQ
ncbi:DUF4168 domain-containing protein [Salegentibacter sp. F188]|uniref:DUF4168 domain-containing protein n=1 Tax=Autumnicola patrickiae TaxID=3075591 RepID=A0ABU3DXF1_9FLAO|nr:DUF4168 domain-containing protein [Salegentibacter sp. F188]MDT0688403.1 DUF4168 domain-containing protein [Salegentibacter sp. F188]